MNFDPEVAAAASERINRLMGLRLKYLISIPIGLGIAWLAAPRRRRSDAFRDRDDRRSAPIWLPARSP